MPEFPHHSHVNILPVLILQFKCWQIIPIPVKSISQEQFTKIYAAITRDNPLIYHMNQSACNLATDGLGHTAICPQYFFSKAKVKEYNRKIEKAVNELVAQLKLTEGTDYDKLFL